MSSSTVARFARRARMHRGRGREGSGVVYTLYQTGTGRLIFDELRNSFQGMLESDDGEVISLRGARKQLRGDDEDTASTSDMMMEVCLVEGEAGNKITLRDVHIHVDRLSASIDSPALNFRTTDRLVGNRADVEISTYMNPEWRGAKEVFVGVMRVQVLATQDTTQALRRESTCCDDNSVAILEQSDDFLA